MLSILFWLAMRETFGVHEAYERVKAAARGDLRSPALAGAITELVTLSLVFLTTECERVDLVSRVPGKEYFSFGREGLVARPANARWFIADAERVNALWVEWDAGSISEDDLAKLTYTVSLGPCLAMELFDRGNKKGPATYFESFIGHVFAKLLRVDATRRATLPILDREVSLTMDFLYQFDEERGVHLPVKMSTRERVVQAWAHQRLLDTGYGEGAYVGLLVVFSETKLDSRTHEVVEICVPDQWLAYQVSLAKMRRIYYLDTPSRYEALTAAYPGYIQIKPLVTAFTEIGSDLPA